MNWTRRRKIEAIVSKMKFSYHMWTGFSSDNPVSVCETCNPGEKTNLDKDYITCGEDNYAEIFLTKENKYISRDRRENPHDSFKDVVKNTVCDICGKENVPCLSLSASISELDYWWEGNPKKFDDNFPKGLRVSIFGKNGTLSGGWRDGRLHRRCWNVEFDDGTKGQFLYWQITVLNEE